MGSPTFRGEGEYDDQWEAFDDAWAQAVPRLEEKDATIKRLRGSLADMVRHCGAFHTGDITDDVQNAQAIEATITARVLTGPITASALASPIDTPPEKP
jgi:hypothetical protein